ncbi:MAG: hypothetical protein IJV32_04300 [Bacteroidales bacterium]|nr:hypothetical protein [Bacteroidales bacterium]
MSKSVHDHSAIAFVNNADEATTAKLCTVARFFDCGDDDFHMGLSVDIYPKMRDKKIE